MDLQIFTNKQFGEIRTIEKSKSNAYFGFFYILEWNDKVKIGCTAHPYQRIRQLQKAADYGRIKTGKFAISQEHTNYRDNEKKLHNHFKQFRLKNTELFEISFDYATSNLPINLLFLDESESIRQGSIKFAEAMKKILPNGAERQSNEYKERLSSIAKTNARVDISEILMELSRLDVFSAEGKSVLLAKAAEVLIGEPIIPPSAFQK